MVHQHRPSRLLLLLLKVHHYSGESTASWYSQCATSISPAYVLLVQIHHHRGESTAQTHRIGYKTSSASPLPCPSHASTSPSWREYSSDTQNWLQNTTSISPDVSSSYKYNVITVLQRTRKSTPDAHGDTQNRTRDDTALPPAMPTCCKYINTLHHCTANDGEYWYFVTQDRPHRCTSTSPALSFS